MKSLVNSQNGEDESFEVRVKMLKLSTCLQIILVSRAGELDRGCTRACAASLAAETHGGELPPIRASVDASAELTDIHVNFAAHELPRNVLNQHKR